MGFFGGKSEIRAAQSAAAMLQREQTLGREKAQELYGQFLPAAGYGAEATQQLRDVVLGGDMSKFYTSPGYQFRLDEGTGAVEKAMAARGGRRSSTAFKSISDYAQQSASGEFDNYLNQLSNFGTQATNIGLQGIGGIMQQYGGVSPGQIAQAQLGVGQAKTSRRTGIESGLMDLGAAGASMAGGMGLGGGAFGMSAAQQAGAAGMAGGVA